MTTRDLHPLLDELADTREVVMGGAVEGDLPLVVWRGAAHDARTAYSAWCTSPGGAGHAAYLAAEDQADAALASLHTHAEPRVLLAA